MAIHVKKLMTRGQSAWLNTIRRVSFNVYFNHQRLNVEHSKQKRNNIDFNQWLVGVTDGDGTFHFSQSKEGK